MEQKEEQQETLLKRKWRKYYRRSRVYVPLIVLLLASMVVFLPVRGAWLARMVERQIKSNAGLDVQIQSAEVHLIEGAVTVQGLTLKPGSGESDITVERIALSGTLADLMAGDGRYPREVEIDYGSPLLIHRTAKGVELDSALRVLIHTIQESTKKDPAEPPKGSGSSPHVILRNVPIRIDDTLSKKVHTAHISQVILKERTNRSAPVEIEIEGLVNDPLPEKFDFTITYLQETGSLNAQVRLNGFEQKFPAKSATPFLSLIAEELQLDVSVLGLNQEKYQLRADLQIGKLQARHLISGGRRWNQRNVTFGINSMLSKTGNPVEEWSALLSTPVLEVAADGTFLSDQDWVGQSSLQIRKTPPILWSIINEQLAPEGFVVDEVTSPTVTLYVNTSGNFKEPRTLTIDSQATLRRLRVQSLSQPYALVVDNLTVSGEPDKITIQNLTGNFADRVTYSVAGSLKNFLEEQPSIQLDRLVLNGDPGNSLVELREVVPELKNILSLSFPMQITASGNFPLRKGFEGWNVDWFQPATSFNGLLKWDSSTIKISQLAQPIQLQPGQFQFTETSANFSSVQAAVGDVQLSGDVVVTSPSGRWITDASYSSNLSVAGALSSIFDLVQQQTNLPFSVTDYSGELKTSIQIRGEIATMLQPDFTLNANIRKFTGRVPLPYSQLNIREGEIDLQVTRDRISIPLLRGIVNDDAVLESASFELTPEAATLSLSLSSTLEVLSKILAHETMDIFMAGKFSSTITASLKPNQPLAKANSILEAWGNALKSAPQPIISLTDPAAPFELSIDGQVTPLPVISVYHRDMPHPIENIRGGLTLDKRGFGLKNVVADLGNAKDATLNGRVNLGHYGGAVQILLDVKANKLDFNEWFTGWGKRDYAKREFVEPSYNVAQNRPEKMITEVEVDLHLRETALLSVRGTELDAHVRYEAWRKKQNILTAKLKDSRVYGGRLEGEAEFILPRNYTQLTEFTSNLRPQEVEMKDYLTDLLGGKDYPRGKVTGDVSLSGKIGDYNTWIGKANFRATKSRFIGEQSFILLTNFLNLGDRERQADTVISGTATAKNQIITFPSIRCESSEIRMLASGTVGFNGMTDFLLTVDLYRNKLGGIPIISELNTFLNRLRNSLISFRVTGKIGEQKVEAVALPVIDIDYFSEGRRQIGNQSNSSRSGSN